jgi:ribonuclease E
MKDALKNDRARIQVGRISSFGLMEMSRQRLRTGVLEASTKPCLHCEGTGLMRTASSSGLSALRIIEDEAARGRGDRILLRAGREAAIYVLNKKRAELAEIDERYGVTVEVMIDEAFEGARMSVESSGGRPMPKDRAIDASVIDEDEDLGDEAYEEEADIEEVAEDEEDQRPARREGGREARAETEEDGARRKRRRRRGGRGRNRRDGEREVGETGDQDEQDLGPAVGDQQPSEEQLAVGEGGEPMPVDDGEERQRSRRGRRGGRSRRGRADAAPGEVEVEADSSPMVETSLADEAPITAVEAPAEIEPVAEEKPKARRRPRARKTEAEAPIEVVSATPDEVAEVAEVVPAAPKRRSRAKKAVLPVDTDAAIELAVADAAAAELPVEASNDQAASEEPAEAEADEGSGARRGWWQRTFG